MTNSPLGPPAGRRRPPPGMVAADEQDYHMGCDELDKFLTFIRNLLNEGWNDFEALIEVYSTLRAQQGPSTATMISAIALVRLAKTPGPPLSRPA